MSNLAENTMSEIKTFEQKPEPNIVVPTPEFLIRKPDEMRRKVYSRIFDLSYNSIVSQIDEGIINLLKLESKPKYQRKYFWSDEKASQLLESIMLNVPIPNCYLAEDFNNHFDVIDGQQRLYSVYRYVNNYFGLTGLKVLPELNGLKFNELPSNRQDDILIRIMSCVIIRNDSHPDVKFEVFKRLNSDSTPLNLQEIRNCIYMGEFNDMLSELANERIWLEIRNRATPDQRMADEELILRFFSFEIQKRENYQPPFDKWLNSAAFAGSKIKGKKLESLRNIWHETLEKSLEWFEPTECFRKSKDRKFNEVLFDLTTYTARKLKKDKIRGTKKEFRRRYNQLLNSSEFKELLNPDDDSREIVKMRVRHWDSMMTEMGK